MKDFYNKNNYDEKKEEKLNKTEFSPIHSKWSIIIYFKKFKIIE
jgi:hypothetical protein